MKVHEKIRSIRNQNQLTQEQVAEKLGISTNGYSKIEKGETKLSLDRLQEIANIFDMDILKLINTENKKIYVQFNENANQQGDNHFYENNQQLQFEVEKLQLIIKHQEQEISHLRQIIDLLQKNS